MTDPLEILIADALDSAGVLYEHEKNGLDFYLPESDLYIEVKRFHAARVADQMARAPNVIAVQGIDAVRWFAEMVKNGSFTGATPETGLGPSGEER